MKRNLPLLSLIAAVLLAVPRPAAALVDLQLVVQMPLAVVEVERVGYPRADLALLASGLVASELAPAEVIDVLRWAPLVWYLDELAGGDLFLDVDTVRLAPEPRRLRLIEDRDGRWLITSREDLVLLDLADRGLERQWVVEREVVVRDVVLSDVDRRRLDGRGMGAYVQWLHERGLRGRELSDAIHAELRRRGVPAGPKDRLDGPPPASRRFVAERLPEVLVVDGRLVELRDGRDGRDDRRFLPPAQARTRLAAAPRFDDARAVADRLARRDGDRAGERGGGRGRPTGPPADRGRAGGRDEAGREAAGRAGGRDDAGRAGGRDEAGRAGGRDSGREDAGRARGRDAGREDAGRARGRDDAGRARGGDAGRGAGRDDDGRARGRDDAGRGRDGGPPDHAAAGRGGRGDGGGARAEGGGQGRGGGGQAAGGGGGGRGKNEARAGGGGGGKGKGQAKKGGGGGGGQDP